MKNKPQNGSPGKGRGMTKLECIAAAASVDLVALIGENRTKILEAWQAVEEQSQENETKPILRIGFSIALDIDADKMASELSFAIRHKASIERSIPDPNQVEMDLERDPEPEAA